MLALLVFLPLGVLCVPEDYHVVGQGGYEEYMSDWNSDTWNGGRLNPPKCIDIPTNMSLCKEIGYTQMRLPNLLDHDTLREVTSQAGQWVPLLGLHCHPDTKLFLCSLFSPVCLDRPIWPCRTLCEAVKSGCESKMIKYGFPWPDMLRCDKFPKDNDLCINKQSEGQPGRPDDSVCPACNHPQTFEAIVDSFCSTDFALRIRVRDNVLTGNDMKITAMKKKKKYKDNNLTKKDLRNLVLYVENAAGCDCPVLTSTGKKDKLIVLGNKVNNRVVVTHMVTYDKQAKDVRRAIKAIQKSKDICKGGIDVITDTVVENEKEKKNKKDNTDKGTKKRKNGNSDLVTPITSNDNTGKGRDNNDNRREKNKAKRKNKNDRNNRNDRNGRKEKNERRRRNKNEKIIS